MIDDKELRKRLQHELQREADEILQIVESDSSVKDATAPPELHETLFREIQKPTEEDELIRLGRIYRRKLKNRKYVVLAAAMVLVLAFGITSVGDVPTIFRNSSWWIGNRKQEVVNSNDIETIGASNEETIYTEIEDSYGFIPVKLNYRPKNVEFQEATIGNDIQGIQLVFGSDTIASIFYRIRPNFRDASLGIDIEDPLISEYEQTTEATTFRVKQYLVENNTVRWSVQFEYDSVSYQLLLLDLNKQEFDKIIDNLYFP